MKIKGIRVLLIVALALEVLALLATVGITAMQSTVKLLYTNDMELLNTLSVPIGSLIKIVPLLICYGISLPVFSEKNPQAAKVKSIVFVAIACLLQVGLQYTSFLGTFIAMNGINALASYNMLESLISQVANPLHSVAFALFCVACGGYYGCKNEEKEVQSFQ